MKFQIGCLNGITHVEQQKFWCQSTSASPLGAPISRRLCYAKPYTRMASQASLELLDPNIASQP